MKRHAGSWSGGANIEEIMTKGSALLEHFHKLRPREFEDYVRETYGIDHRRALDWLNATKRFADCPELVNDLPETIIRKLAAPSINMSDVKRIVADIRAGNIESDTRSVNQVISQCRKPRNKKRQQKAPDIDQNFVYLSKSAPLPQSTLEEIETQKGCLEALKLESEKDAASLRAEIIDFDAKAANAKEKEKQRQAEINEFDKHIQALAHVLKLHGRG